MYEGKRGVTSQHPLASEAAHRILEEGGNAYDAALTASAVMVVVSPYSSNLGGDGFLLSYSGGELIAYNGSGRSPSGFNVNEFIKNEDSHSPINVTIPGLVDLWWFLQEEKLISKPLETLLRPAISLAENGFEPSPYLRKVVKGFLGVSNKEFQRYIAKFKERVTLRGVSNVLREFSTKGKDAFYANRKIVDGLRTQGVKLENIDFEKHRGEKVKTVGIDYMEERILELPPNSRGLLTLAMLKKEGDNPVESFYEVMEGVHYITDPNFYNTNLEEILKLRKGKRDKVGDGDTTFLATADEKGNLVGLIQSLYHPFGSCLVVDDIVFQNRALGFSKRLDVPNKPEPNKRPSHTLSIVMLEEEGKRAVIGCTGGDLRPLLHYQVITKYLESKSIEKAIAEPRITIRKGEVVAEENSYLSKLASKVVKYPSEGFGIFNAIEVNKDKVKAVHDFRWEGLALVS
jgi:gamma-glutamyltranspeptidase/glutathione hydrolase